MSRLTPAEFGKAAAGGGAWLAGGTVLVSIGILTGLLMTGLLRLPFTSHDRIGLVPVVPAASGPPGQHHPQPSQPPLPVIALPPHAATPVPARAVPSHSHPRPLVSPQRARPGCQRGECKRPPAPLPVPAPVLPSLSVSVPSLSHVPAASSLPAPSVRASPPSVP